MFVSNWPWCIVSYMFTPWDSAEADIANLRFLALPTIKTFDSQDGDKYRAQHQLCPMTFLILHREIHCSLCNTI
ncbi:uncharacterized protein F5147DRAFT_712867 [Suillus discolor]|uniref:Uncharacterized protein n=1 Tax=Suillus discolor TaxID=1912936 RepID=A0A9P7F0A1_9AGAM|nr:uncharacterized protein F5147DRAFT_712867 [Suillus discolor]KAG2098950.1 hypothetical protein F5147DRAFT_712867 [Suillus discolor]